MQNAVAADNVAPTVPDRERERARRSPELPVDRWFVPRRKIAAVCRLTGEIEQSIGNIVTPEINTPLRERPRREGKGRGWEKGEDGMTRVRDSKPAKRRSRSAKREKLDGTQRRIQGY